MEQGALTTSESARSPEVVDELIRSGRERAAGGVGQRRVRATYLGVAIAFVATAAVTAATRHAGRGFSPWWLLFSAALYAIVSRVEFEIGTGLAIPTELVFVPMLFSLPVGAVPGTVALGLILGLVIEARGVPQTERLLGALASAWHTLGPVLVLEYAGGMPLRWTAWPIYLGALGAQFAFDFASTAVLSGFALRVPLSTLARFLGWVYLVDASLAPIGLMLAFAAQVHPALPLLVLPLVLLLRSFSQERSRRIDHALELSDAYRGTAFLLGDVVEADDAYTGSHSRHVVELVLAVGDELGLSPEERRDSEFVALLHDVGKIRVPSEIINKKGPLDDAEREVMKQHTIEGERLLERIGGVLGHVGRIVRSCHEHYDGSGYPDGLAGEQIPLVARIVCACDAFSAMTTDRPYRGALSLEEALAELERCAGTQFDPDVVRAILAVNRTQGEG